MEQGGEGAARSNMAAFQVLKMSVYARTPAELRVEVRDLPDVNQAAMLVDLEGLTQSLEQRLVDLETQIAAGRTLLGSGQAATPEIAERAHRAAHQQSAT